MTKQIINIGQTANDRSGDPLRTAFNKVNSNFNELYALVGNSVDYMVGAPLSSPTGVSLDLTKNIQVLNDALYTLTDGIEGQIMYFVPATSSNISVVIVENARIRNNNVAEVSQQYWSIPYYNSVATYDNSSTFISGFATISIAIFTDGAWNLLGGNAD